MSHRSIVVGDIHGCLIEFDELLRTVEFKQGHDRLILAGDLVDRGPDSAGVVRRAMEIGAESVIGNHEEVHLRFLKHDVAHIETGKINPMAKRLGRNDFKIVQNTLGEREWGWIRSLPNYIHIDDRWTVVHAGCLPGIAVEDQNPRHLWRLRYVRRASGEMAPLDEEMRPATHAYWTELWTGPRSIVYGHHVEKRGPVWSHFQESRVDPFLGVVHEASAVGIDTGCAFGGSLSAVIFTNNNRNYETVSVAAKGKWAELYSESGDE